ncbi:MAG TPA: hypothetical protein PKH44_03215, partial [Plasticicumulans sp.]|nr:hypothetical protein [Plasticicumulans sp.]
TSDGGRYPRAFRPATEQRRYGTGPQPECLGSCADDALEPGHARVMDNDTRTGPMLAAAQEGV